MSVKVGLDGIEVGYAGSLSNSGIPKRLSPNAQILCDTEWSWSPAHSRADRYLLHCGRRDWFLWVSYHDDFSGRVESDVIARVPKAGVDADKVGKMLLTAFWSFDHHECDVDRPHYFNPGTLSSEVLQDIMDTVWGIETVVSPELIKAYKNTDFCVLEPKKFVLRIGMQSPDLAKLYLEMGVHSAGFLTAWNPHSGVASVEKNMQALNDLYRALSLDGLPTLKAIGLDPSGEWPGEESFLIPGISIERAKALGAEFQQNAIVWAGSNAVPNLILLR